MRKKTAKDVLQETRSGRRGNGRKGGLHRAETLYPRVEGKKGDRIEAVFLDMVEARDKWERLRDDEVVPAVSKHGVHDDPEVRPEQAVLLIGDYKVAYQGTRRETIDATLAAAIIEKKLPKLAAEVLVEKVVLDVAAYRTACNEGRVPQKLRDKIEKNVCSYGLRWWQLPTVKCTECNAVVDKEARFCPKCGESMVRDSDK